MMSEKGSELPPQEQPKLEQKVEHEIGNRELPIWGKMPEILEAL